MAKSVGPRTVVANRLNKQKEILEYLRSNWVRVSRKVLVDRPAGMSPADHEYFRPRRLDEYPENQLKEWENLARYSRALSVSADRLADYASQKAEQLRASKGDG